ncbi:unnamed protein product [Paramecium octaurelia]|uniref:Uncharacterized protein n=1 Tax=Paramecium octaurelia TaxID=43137 RepID=A0A8S1YF50_PAROT|nr:unnamed protein product [Paramecium octaurelia]
MLEFLNFQYLFQGKKFHSRNWEEKHLTKQITTTYNQVQDGMKSKNECFFYRKLILDYYTQINEVKSRSFFIFIRYKQRFLFFDFYKQHFQLIHFYSQLKLQKKLYQLLNSWIIWRRQPFNTILTQSTVIVKNFNYNQFQNIVYQKQQAKQNLSKNLDQVAEMTTNLSWYQGKVRAWIAFLFYHNSREQNYQKQEGIWLSVFFNLLQLIERQQASNIKQEYMYQSNTQMMKSKLQELLLVNLLEYLDHKLMMDSSYIIGMLMEASLEVVNTLSIKLIINSQLFSQLIISSKISDQYSLDESSELHCFCWESNHKI